MSNAGELACTYACLILNDEGIPITADKISALIKAAKVPVESYWPALFAKFTERRNIDDLILAAGGGDGGGVAAPATGAGVVADAAAPVAKEEKKEEVAEESDDENMFSLFD